MILVIISKFVSEVIYKRSRVSKVFPKKDLELYLFYRSVFQPFLLVFILSLLKVNIDIKKQNDKSDLIEAYSLNSIKIILVLLIKLVVVYIGLFNI